MPLIKPEVQNILRKAGLERDREVSPSGAEETVSQKLDRAGLSLDEIAEELTLLAKSSGNEALRHRALETALKAHGALKDTPLQIPSFTFVIQGSPTGSGSSNPETNPILFPRQSLDSLPAPDKIPD